MAKRLQTALPSGRRCRALVLASISVFDVGTQPATPTGTDGPLSGQMRFCLHRGARRSQFLDPEGGDKPCRFGNWNLNCSGISNYLEIVTKCLIVILDRCLGGGRMLAEQLSERLGYRFIDESAVIEMAAARGGSYRDIRAFLEKPPVGFVSDASVSRYYLCLALLRAALAEEAVGGDAVYCGDAGYLLPKGPLSPVLRIQTSAPTEVRIAAARQHLALTEAEAKTYIRKADRRQQAWVRHVTGVGDEDPYLYDLVIDLQHMDTRVACLGIAAFVQQQTSREAARNLPSRAVPWRSWR